MAKEPILTIEQLRQLLDCDPEAGTLTWKPRDVGMFADTGSGGAAGACARWNGRCAGKVAGATRPDGYQCVAIRAHGHPLGRFLVHQVIFAMTHGRWAQGDIDHIDGNPSNNRSSNLREVSRSVNMRNARRRSNNSSGLGGVYRDRRGLWCANIWVGGKCIYLGSSESFEEACRLRREANMKCGFTERHGV